MALVRERTQSKGRPVGGLLRVVLIIRLLAGEGMKAGVVLLPDSGW